MDLAIIKAQADFADAFGSTYPLCETVGHGLQMLLESSLYNGSQHDFTAKFVQPTLELLRNLKAEGFPLVKDGYIIVHLVVPADRLESSEMFFQVGRTTPGTLALKFTKYDVRSGVVLQQPSEVVREDYYKAFTLNYLEDLRSKATNLGDQLMRVLLVSVPVPSAPSRYNVRKIEAKQVIPKGCPSLFIPVRETAGHAMVRMPSQNDEDPSHATPPAQLRHAGRAVTPEPVQVSDADCPQKTQRVTFDEAEYPTNQTAANWSPDRDKDVTSPHVELPVQVSQSESMKEGDQPIADAAEVLLSDSQFPPTKECMSRNDVTQASVSNAMAGENNPKYPPIRRAMNDNEASVWTKKGGTEEELSAKSVSKSSDNPKYPPTGVAVQSQAEGTRPNPQYPPITDAVNDNPWCATTCLQTAPLSVTGANNPAYPPAEQAVKCNSECSSANHDCAAQGDAARTQDGAVSSPSVTEARNILYPLPEDVMFQSGKTRGRHDEGATLTSGAKDSNSAYPPVDEALRFLSGDASSNPKYPPVIDAVKEDGQGTVAVAGTASARNTGISNRTYPPLAKAVGSSSDCASFNPKYPLISDAMKHDAHDCGVRGVSKLVFPSPEEAIQFNAQRHNEGEISLNVAETSTPSYPAGEGVESSCSTLASSNPKYPTITEAIKNNTHGTLADGETGVVYLPEEDAEFLSSKPQGGHAEEATFSDLTGAANFVESSSGCADSSASLQAGGGEGARKETTDKSTNSKAENNVKAYPDFLEDDNNSLF